MYNESPKFNHIIRNYVNKEADKNQELLNLESSRDKASKFYPESLHED